MTDQEWFEKRADAAKECIKNFKDDAEERAFAWACDEIKRLMESLESIAEMKIPYCDGYDVACSMRDEAKSAIMAVDSDEKNNCV